MIVDELRTRDLGERVERSARLRWIGGEFRLRIEVPAGFEPPENDATGLMFVALMLAMYRGEDLQLDGAVSRRALEQTERMQAIFAAWDPAARRCRVRATELAHPRPAPAGYACLLSRGADSLYSATAADAGALTQLVFCDSLEPIQDERVRAQERRLAGEVGDVIGLPVAQISTNLRDPGAELIDYYDIHGAAIAFMAHSLGGALGRIRVPTGMTYSVPVPASTHPLVDPLYSSETLEFEHHGLEIGRPGKVAHVAVARPELLRYLKVCYSANTEANCGRCRKCLWTMVCLQAAGVLRAARLFPDTVDVDAVRALRIDDVALRLVWLQAAAVLGDAPEDRRVREAIRHALRRSARPSPAERGRAGAEWLRGRRARLDPAWSATASHHYRHHTNAIVATVMKGVPYRYGIEVATPQPQPAWSVGSLQPGWAPPPQDAPELVGLLRLLDPHGRRHCYAAGRVPPLVGAVRIGELGALRRERPPAGVAVWVDVAGGVRIEDAPARNGVPRALPIARWVLAPARWQGFATPRARAAELGRRVLDSAATLRHAPRQPEPEAAAPAGYLHAEDGNGRLALYAASHAVTGDQLLSTDVHESGDLGYGAAVVVGYLEAAAPATGSLELAHPPVPWASRFGQRRTAR